MDRRSIKHHVMHEQPSYIPVPYRSPQGSEYRFPFQDIVLSFVRYRPAERLLQRVAHMV